MPAAIDLILFAVAALVLIPLAVFTAEVALSLLARVARSQAPPGNAERATSADAGHGPRTTVLIPAHNEEPVIAATLRRLLPTLGAGDRVLVVADNCTDATAGVARACGADVVERTDPVRRGKAWALDCGVRALAADPPEVVIVLDADCDVDPRTVATLSRRAAVTGRPAQALNLSIAGPHEPRSQAPPGNEPHGGNGAQRGNELHGVQAVSELGFRFKNLVRPLGLSVLGLPCHLMGTGMALPWALAERARWAGDHLAEDMQLGLDLAVAGAPAVFCPEARVTSRFPERPAAWLSQRTRWEQGHLRTLFQQVPRLLWAAFKQRRVDLLALALDLLVPPLSLLIMIWLAATAIAAAAWLCGASAGPLLLLVSGGAVTLAAVAGGWAVHCRERIPLRALAAVPGYIVRKVPIYVSFFLRRGERRWVRTERDTREGGHVAQRSILPTGQDGSLANAVCGAVTGGGTSRNPLAPSTPSFPGSAWERDPRRSASHAAESGTRSVADVRSQAEPGNEMLRENARVRLFGIEIDPLRMPEAVERVMGWLAAPASPPLPASAEETNGRPPRRCRYVVTPNCDHVVLLTEHEGFKAAYRDADLVLVDGMPVVWASRLLRKPVPERVTGADLVPALFDAGRADRPLTAYLLGALPGVAERAAACIEARWPHVRVAGMYSPPFGFERHASENEAIVARIAAVQPDVLVVGLGAPKQECWVHTHRDRLEAGVALCVGATIDFLAGEKPRAPLWMRRSGLEWLHRMLSEPRRLARRYARDACIFPGLVWREWRAKAAAP